MESMESVNEKVNEFIKNKFSYNSDTEFECTYKKIIHHKKKKNKIII